ncbi:MAG: V-type ATP synthase subunit E [Pseudorhodoplanes sp.]|nr:V-type ATP synthase subunit E [Pseudorhodoplanes sp.]
MGHEELIAALRQEAAAKALAIREEAGAEAERIRRDTDRRIKDIREKYGQQAAVLAREAEEIALSQARQEARGILLTAEAGLAGRACALVGDMLASLRQRDYAAVFDALIAELPVFPWEVVRVNPADEALAKERFREAVVQTDPSITGGLEVSDRAGNVRVINTFEKRIENLWPEILPDLVREIPEAAV